MAAGFLSLLVVSSMPVAELLLVGVAGAFLATARCGNVLTPSARADINRVVYAVFTPALMLASLANTVTLRDVVAWWFMPVNIGIAFLAGGALGWVAVLLLRPPQQLRGLVIASCSAANFGNLLLVVIPAVCEEDGNPFGLAKTICTDHGLSYASFSMALGGLYIWTHTHSIMKRSGEVYRRMRQAASSIAPVTCVVVDPSTESVIRQEENKHSENDGGSGAISPSSQSIVAKGEHQISVPLLSDSSNHHRSAEGNNLWGRLKEGTHEMTQELTSPPTTGAAIGLVIGTVPWLRSVFVGSNAPLRAVQDSLKLLGDGTIPCLMLILGGNLTKGLRKTKVPPAVVVAIICVRYVILPLVGVAVVRAARDMGFLPPDPLYQYTLMMHFAVPPAMSIGTMSQLYDVGQEECSVILLWTYLVAALALTVWSTIFMWILQ